MGCFSEVIGAGAVREPARVLALRLHALHADDREWMLAQLPADARSTLEELLAELHRLGFPALPELRSSESSGLGDTHSNQDNNALVIVNNASCEQVWEVLRGEPEAIRNYILSVHGWRWRDELAQRQYVLPGTMRIDPEELVAERAGAALIRALAGRIPDGGADYVMKTRAVSESRPTSTSLRQRIAVGLRRPIAWLR